MADEIPPWGTAPRERDRKLREFWHTEPFLAGAIFTTVARYAAFGWSLKGPTRVVEQVDKVLNGVERGGGWNPWILKILTDLLTQDNGAFFETVRESDDPRAPVVTLQHLDSNRCIRTGRPMEPVIYRDLDGVMHKLKYYQVQALEEFPSPIEEARGMQYCVVTRLLKAAQVMRDLLVYQREKISGRRPRAVHLISGVQRQTIEDAMRRADFSADSAGLTRYMQPVIVASLDPTSQVSKETIELASLPDGFDYDTSMKWYISVLALAFGADYQDFAPLPGGNLGSAQQSETLHLKSRGKGPRLFMNLLESKFNYQGIMPRSVTFSFGDQDIVEDMQHARGRMLRAQERAARIKSGEITPEVARLLAVSHGDLEEDHLALLKASDAETAAHPPAAPPGNNIDSDLTRQLENTHGQTAV